MRRRADAVLKPVQLQKGCERPSDRKAEEENAPRNDLIHHLPSFNRGRAVVLCTSAEPECLELVAPIAQRDRDAL